MHLEPLINTSLSCYVHQKQSTSIKHFYLQPCPKIKLDFYICRTYMWIRLYSPEAASGQEGSVIKPHKTSHWWRPDAATPSDLTVRSRYDKLLPAAVPLTPVGGGRQLNTNKETYFFRRFLGDVQQQKCDVIRDVKTNKMHNQCIIVSRCVIHNFSC